MTPFHVQVDGPVDNCNARDWNCTKTQKKKKHPELHTKLSRCVIRSVKAYLLGDIFHVKSLPKRKLKYAKQVREVTN